MQINLLLIIETHIYKLYIYSSYYIYVNISFFYTLLTKKMLIYEVTFFITFFIYISQ